MTSHKNHGCNHLAFQGPELDTAPSVVAIQPRFAYKNETISFFGGFGLGNFGNEITLQAILYHLNRRFPNAEVSCICTHPEVTAANYNIKTLPLTPTVFSIWKPNNRMARLLRSFSFGIPSEIYRWILGLTKLRHIDVFIIPGTGLLTDAYGLRSWGPYSLFKWSIIAKVCRCKLLFVSVGAGPLHGRIGRWLVKSALALADYRSYRDCETKEYLRSIGVGRPGDRVYPDLAFSIVDEICPKRTDPNRCRAVVGLGLMLYHGALSSDQDRDSTYAVYLEKLVVFGKWLLVRGYSIRLLIGEFSDRSVTAEFKALLIKRLGGHNEERILDEPTCSVQDLLTQLSQTDVVVATRFHNILLALALNKPTICVSFHQKCTSLMQDMGLAEYCQDIKKLDSAKLIEQFCRLEQNSESLKPMIRAKVEDCRRALDEQYDLIFKDLLAE